MDYWNAAKKNCEDLFALNLYSLVPNYVDNFTSLNEFNSESIFELPYKYTGANSYVGDYSGFHRPQYAGLYLASSGGGAWDDVSAREWVLEEFDKEKDKDGNTDIRKHYTLFFDDPYDPDEILYHGMTWKQLDEINHFNKKCYWRKYTQPDSKTGYTERYSSDVNCRMIRLAEIYLNYAEALNEYNPVPPSAAYDALDKVRQRSGLPKLNRNMSTDEFRQKVRNERAVELAFEGHRLWDIRRWEIAEQEGVMQGAMYGLLIQASTINKNDFHYKPVVFESRSFNKRMYRHPFSIGEMEKGYLIQNPGYN